MTNSGIQPRIVASAAKGLIFATLVFPLGIASVSAWAGANIQMLPPVTEATKLALSPTPCPPGGSPNILTWDGTNPLSCSTGVMVANGSVGIGTAGPTRLLDVYGTGGTPSLSTSSGEVAYFDNNVTQGLAVGAMSATPYSMWLQVKRATNDGTSWPLALNPLGGNVGVGTTMPQGNLDIENGSNTANICLNGLCAAHINKLVATETIGMSIYSGSSGEYVCYPTGGPAYWCGSQTTASTHDLCVLSSVESSGLNNNCFVASGTPGGLWTLTAQAEQMAGGGGETNCALSCYDFQ
jgi:hypothetical protein